MENVFIRAEYNYDTNEASLEAGLDCPEPSLAQQQFCEECDINTIVRRFGLTGEIPQGLTLPTYGDFTGVSDYQSALDAITMAEDSFMQLPHDIRTQFENDPGLFVDFCSDPANLPALQEMGLAPKPTPYPLEPIQNAEAIPTPTGTV